MPTKRGGSEKKLTGPVSVAPELNFPDHEELGPCESYCTTRPEEGERLKWRRTPSLFHLS